MTDPHTYQIDPRTRLVATALTRKGKNGKLERMHFGVVTDDAAVSFVLDAKQGAVLEKFVRKLVRRHARHRGD